MHSFDFRPVYLDHNAGRVGWAGRELRALQARLRDLLKQAVVGEARPESEQRKENEQT